VKKLSLIITAFIFVLSLSSVSLADMTADDIITKHLENTGGIDNYKNIKSVKFIGKGFAQQMTFEITLVKKAPNLYAMNWNSEMANIEMGSDGKEVWQLFPGATGYIMTSEEDLPSALEGYLMNPYLDYKKRGATAKLIGEEQVKGAETYKVEYVQAAGDTVYSYFDKTNFNLLKQSSGEGDVVFSKFKKVGNFTFPHTMNIYQAGQTIMMVFKSIEIDGDVDNAMFVAPADSMRAPPEFMEKIKQAQKDQEAAKKAAEADEEEVKTELKEEVKDEGK